ncbi:hypothetical protein SAVIM40S_07826 [Streptomyces avidinii]|uniref:Uncharacterized protein n=1 Tax=Streptomyces avidinii TaxID=1895 RepID=A0ABS4KZJ6_STRAV|nr:hypothetical protein [Streptomyces avidinii]
MKEPEVGALLIRQQEQEHADPEIVAKVPAKGKAPAQ